MEKGQHKGVVVKASRVWLCSKCGHSINPGEKMLIVDGEIMHYKCKDIEPYPEE